MRLYDCTTPRLRICAHVADDPRRDRRGLNRSTCRRRPSRAASCWAEACGLHQTAALRRIVTQSDKARRCGPQDRLPPDGVHLRLEVRPDGHRHTAVGPQARQRNSKGQPPLGCREARRSEVEPAHPAGARAVGTALMGARWLHRLRDAGAANRMGRLQSIRTACSIGAGRWLRLAQYHGTGHGPGGPWLLLTADITFGPGRARARAHSPSRKKAQHHGVARVSGQHGPPGMCLSLRGGPALDHQVRLAHRPILYNTTGLAGTGGSRISESTTQLGARQRLAHTIRAMIGARRWQDLPRGPADLAILLLFLYPNDLMVRRRERHNRRLATLSGSSNWHFDSNGSRSHAVRAVLGPCRVIQG